MVNLQDFKPEFLIRVLAAIPIEKAVKLRSVNREWKELIECSLYWNYIDEILISFRNEWINNLEEANGDLKKLISQLQKEPEDDENRLIIEYLSQYKIDEAGFEKDYLRYQIFPDGPVEESDMPMSTKFGLNLGAPEKTWQERVSSIEKFKKAVSERHRFWLRRPEIQLLLEHPYKQEGQCGDLTNIRALFNLLTKMKNFFESGVEPYKFA